jgi:integrase
MAAERIFDEVDVQELLEQNAAPPFGARNAALILGGVYWGLTPLELCLISTEDVVAPNGEFYRVWVLPKHASFNGADREVHTADHMLPFFERYVDLRKDQNWGLSSNLHSHRGLSPSSRFFLNDRGEPYKPTERKNKPGSYQPRSMLEQLKRMIDRTGLYGATPASYRDSFIKGMFDNGAGWSDLMKVTGIKQKRTLEKKVRPHERELETVLASLFSRVKMPQGA